MFAERLFRYRAREFLQTIVARSLSIPETQMPVQDVLGSITREK